MGQLEYIELADGTRVSTASGEVIRDKKPQKGYTPNAPTHSNELISTRLSDLPLEAKRMNGVAALIVYRLLGMPDHDIAEALGIDVDQVKQISNAQVFNDLYSKINAQVLDRSSNDLRIAIAAMSRDALNKVYEVMTEGDDKNALKAAQDILDRAGHRPADVVMHQHHMSGGLKIEYIERKKENDLPIIEMEG
jgi:hypothetical protein